MFVDGSGCHFGFACDMTKPLPWLRQCLKVHDFTRVPLHRANWCKLCKESKNVFGIVCVFPNDFQCDCVLMLWFCTTASSSSSSLSSESCIQLTLNLFRTQNLGVCKHLGGPKPTMNHKPGAWGFGICRGTHVGTRVSDILRFWWLEYAWILCSNCFRWDPICCFFSTWTLWSFKSLCFNSLSSRR